MWSNVRAMHIRPDARKDQMNRATGDVVAPGLVETAKRLELQPRGAFQHVGVLLIFSRALFLDQWADSCCGGFLDRKVSEVDSGCCCGPGLQVRDPGVVFEH